MTLKLTCIIDVVRPNVDRTDSISIHIKNDTQIGFYLYCVDCAPQKGREALNFVRSQPRIKRVLFENFPRSACRLFLARRKVVEVPPEGF